MKEQNKGMPYSLVNRRTFLRRIGIILGGWFLGTLLLPLWQYVFPGMSREPDKVEFSEELLSQLNALKPGNCLRFAWGGFPGLILRARNGEFRTFKGVCSHADCNVRWRPAKGDFYCACHEGRYDEYGRNIEGPPPRPLTTLVLEVETDGNRIIKATAWRSEAVRQKKLENA